MPSTDVGPIVRQIAAAGLSDRDGPPLVPGTSWSAVLSRLDTQRLTGLAVWAAEQGRLELDDDQASELLDHHRSAMVLVLRLEQQLIRIVDDFRIAGIRAVVLKGSAVAHGTYPDPSMRPFGDLDLLVSAGDWRAACDRLRSLGYARRVPEPRRGFDERFGKAATHANASGRVVDLHRTLVLGPFGLWLDPDQLLRHTDAFVLAGHRIERLDPTGILLNAALHATLGTSPPLLLPIRDVVHAARDPRVDWDRLGEWVARWRLVAPVRHAFGLASETMGVELPHDAARVVVAEPRRSEMRALTAHVQRRRAGGVALAATRAIPGVRAKTTYLLGLWMPSREFLRARAGRRAHPSYLARWWIPIRGWAVRRPGPGRRLRGVGGAR